MRGEEGKGVCGVRAGVLPAHRGGTGHGLLAALDQSGPRSGHGVHRQEYVPLRKRREAEESRLVALLRVRDRLAWGKCQAGKSVDENAGCSKMVAQLGNSEAGKGFTTEAASLRGNDGAGRRKVAWPMWSNVARSYRYCGGGGTGSSQQPGFAAIGFLPGCRTLHTCTHASSLSHMRQGGRRAGSAEPDNGGRAGSEPPGDRPKESLLVITARWGRRDQRGRTAFVGMEVIVADVYRQVFRAGRPA